MTDRYDDLSLAAKNLLAGFDEIDLADMLADSMDAGVRLRQQLAGARTAAFREAADLIEAKAKTVLDDIPEDEQDPSDQDRYQEWLSAGDVLRAEAKVAPPEPGTSDAE